MLVCWSVGMLVCWYVGMLVGMLVCWYVGMLICWYVGMLDRIRLFDAVVTPTVLYGSATWALLQSMEKSLRTVRRRMLRYVFRIHRRKREDALEDWVSFVQRSAHTVDNIASAQGMVDWVTLHRRRKWKSAGAFARKTNGRWSKQVLEWSPSFEQKRSQSRPKLRWADDIEKVAGGDWMEHALVADMWSVYEEAFVESSSCSAQQACR